MAIDSSLFGATIPAGTYTVGDTIQLGCIAGPSVVRSGRGVAQLKRVTTGLLIAATGSESFWIIKVKNSDWIDEMSNLSCPLEASTALDERTGAVQSGNNCGLTSNSSWIVTAECVVGSTPTIANSIFAIIDVDYPSVSSVIDPDALTGIPTSIIEKKSSMACQASSISTATWTVDNVDIFKAGYEYALTKTEMVVDTGVSGFIALSNAAGMGGLTRIVPVTNGTHSIRNKMEYATKLVKGPMDIKYMLFSTTGSATTGNVTLIMDFVKHKV